MDHGAVGAAAAGDRADPGAVRDLLPPLPQAVPRNLTKATAKYKRQAWLALAGLLLFVAIYLSLTAWFAWTAYRLIAGALGAGGGGVFGYVGGTAAALMAVFLIKALFSIKHGGASDDGELNPHEQPELFAYLHRLADAAGAPRPHRVLVSARVNAAVFYDLSFWNLLWPAKKNLEIGLGLVNTLNLSETTAVLAHEFGHFAQRSMAVGRWVYTAQQVAGHIVAARGWLDRMLGFISGVDLRVAWVGWILRLVVWSIRSLLDTVFGLVVMAQRALSREMEFAADRVAVSLTGSDALVHALHRLGAADEAWNEALSASASELAQGRIVPDVFALQTHVIARIGRATGDPQHGQSPVRPARAERAAHRLFQAELAEPPRMWSTHPSNRDREDSAKRDYVEAELDARPAWCLFRDPDAVRRQATARLLAQIAEGRAGKAAARTLPSPEPVTVEAAFAAVDRRFDRSFLDQRYRGAYLGRSVVLHEKKAANLYGPAIPRAALAAEIAGLYPERLATDLADMRSRLGEKASLDALRDGILEAPGGVIRYRGQVIKRGALPAVLAQVSKELEEVRARVAGHDRACRTAHRSAAAELGEGWEPYLVGLGRLLHYAGHLEADVEDAKGHLGNVFAVVTADGRVSSGERSRLVRACNEVHVALWNVFDNRNQVRLPAPVLERLEEKSWSEALPKDFALPMATEESLGEWLQVIDGWIGGTLAALGTLERVSLELLLEVEAHVARCFLEGAAPGRAPDAPEVPAGYQTLVPGEERERQKKLDWWSRFVTADGLVPSVARFAVAGAILAVVLGFGGGVGRGVVTIYNGLGTSVVVDVGGERARLGPREHQTLTLPSSGEVAIEARAPSGQVIERFTPDVSRAFRRYVYNVGAAGLLVEWTATYGNVTARPARRLGTDRWQSSDADVLFSDPPRTVSTKGGGATRTVLSAGELTPKRMLESLKDADEKSALVRIHAEWDLASAGPVVEWLELARTLPDHQALLARRLARDPEDVAALRAEQDAAPSGDARRAVCARHRALAEAHPETASLSYVAARCIEDRAERDEAFIRAGREHPGDGWCAFAAGFSLAERHDFRGAAARLAVAVQRLPALGDVAGLELGRLTRVLGPSLDGGVATWAAHSAGLQARLELERGEGIEGAMRAYKMLAEGKLDAAVSLASSDPSVHARVLRLAAASDGADPALVDAARALPEGAGMDNATIWTALALEARGRAPKAGVKAGAKVKPAPASDAGEDTPLVKRAREMTPEDVERVLRFTDARFLRRDLDAAEKSLGTLPAWLRGEAYAMALVVLGDAAPERWRSEAKGLLFSAERPFFR